MLQFLKEQHIKKKKKKEEILWHVFMLFDGKILVNIVPCHLSSCLIFMYFKKTHYGMNHFF